MSAGCNLAYGYFNDNFERRRLLYVTKRNLANEVCYVLIAESEVTSHFCFINFRLREMPILYDRGCQSVPPPHPPGRARVVCCRGEDVLFV
jgi:hypothetical protein